MTTNDFSFEQPPRHGEGGRLDRHHSDPQIRQFTALLSTTNTNLVGTAPRHMRATSLFGTVKLDLRETTFDHIILDIRVFAGDVEIRVGEGVSLHNTALLILSEVKTLGLRPIPGGPLIETRGSVVMGTIKVIGPDHVSLMDRIKGQF